jgi:two-component system NtrC family sensor kinase
MRTRRDAALRSLRLMLAASVIFPLLLFGYAAWANYHAAFERADERIKQALDLSAEQPERAEQPFSESALAARVHGVLAASES